LTLESHCAEYDPRNILKGKIKSNNVICGDLQKKAATASRQPSEKRDPGMSGQWSLRPGWVQE
jgi:hypothetical protein